MLILGCSNGSQPSANKNIIVCTYAFIFFQKKKQLWISNELKQKNCENKHLVHNKSKKCVLFILHDVLYLKHTNRAL